MTALPCPRCGGKTEYDEEDDMYLCSGPGFCTWFEDPDDSGMEQIDRTKLTPGATLS